MVLHQHTAALDAEAAHAQQHTSVAGASRLHEGHPCIQRIDVGGVVAPSWRLLRQLAGGAGFLGEHIVRQLLEAGTFHVTVLDMRACDVPGASSLIGDLTRPTDLLDACKGKDVVFHVASAAVTAQNASSGRELMTSVNVFGTQNLITACRHAGVPRLVYTSSASVVFEGKPLVDVDESYAYAAKPMDFYSGTKMEAEQLVLAANDATLATCALRPSGIIGPGKDRILVPSVAARCRTGKMKYIIGSGQNVFDWTYVGNVAAAHVCAAERLQVGSPVAGQVFFVTNDEPMGFWQVLGDLAEGLGYARPSVKLPVWLMMIVAYIVAYLSAAFGIQSDLNPMRVRVASVQRTLSCAKAKRLLGYKPSTSMKQGIELTLADFQYLRKQGTTRDKGA